MFGLGSGEDVRQAVIAFVARVLVQDVVDPRHRHLGGPRLRKRRRIVDRERIQQCVGIEAAEPLDEMELRTQRLEKPPPGDCPASVVDPDGVGDRRRSSRTARVKPSSSCDRTGDATASPAAAWVARRTDQRPRVEGQPAWASTATAVPTWSVGVVSGVARPRRCRLGPAIRRSQERYGSDHRNLHGAGDVGAQSPSVGWPSQHLRRRQWWRRQVHGCRRIGYRLRARADHGSVTFGPARSGCHGASYFRMTPLGSTASHHAFTSARSAALMSASA